jgi:fumarate hydratase subunit alpha/L(+)-tartrate dehydratase alpha subunit
MTLRIDPARVEEAAKELYIRALKMLPPDVKRGFDALVARETDTTAKSVLGVMVRNIAVAEQTDNLLCQDTGIPIYNVTIGRAVVVDGVALKAAIPEGLRARDSRLSVALVGRASVDAPQRAHVVRRRHPGHSLRLLGRVRRSADRDDSEGFGSENNSWLRMAVPADGIDAIKRFVVDCVLDAGGRRVPPTIVGVGIGGTSDLCVHLAKRAATRPLGTRCAEADAAALEDGAHEGSEHARRGPARARRLTQRRSPCMSSSPRRTSR